MDDYLQKIASGNVFVQTQAVSSLYEKIVASNKEGNDVSKGPEITSLYKSAKCGSTKEASVAIAGLTALVKQGTVPAVTLLSNLLADVLIAQHPAPSVQAITSLMLLMCEKDWSAKSEKDNGQSISEKNQLINPFTGPPKGPVSPLVTLVRKKPELADLVVEECSYLLNHPDPRVREISLSLVRPLFLYGACLSDSNPVSLLSPLLNLLLQAYSVHQHFQSEIVQLIITAARLSKGSSKTDVERKTLLLTALSGLSLQSANSALQRALLPALVTALPPATEQGVSVRTLVRHVLQLLDRLGGDSCDVTLAAIAVAIPAVNPSLQAILLKCCGKLVSSSTANPIVCCTVLPSVLQVLAAPCSVAPALAAAASALSVILQHKPPTRGEVAIRGNPYWPSVSAVFPSLPPLLTMARTCNELVAPEVCTRWLSGHATVPNKLGTINRLIVTAVFLYQGSPPAAVVEAAKVLEKEVVKQRSGAVELFPMVLYKLARDRQPAVRLTLLHLLPSLACNKLCVSLILKTIYAMWSSPSLRPVLLRVAYDLWRVEPRVYPHLLKLLKMAEGSKGTSGWVDGETAIARAYVISCICKDKPSQHGEELLPVLSSILNTNGGRGTTSYCSYNNRDPTTSALIATGLCCLALQAITELVRGGVIDLRTTWKVLAPQLAKDKRPDVTCCLCKLLALAAKFQVKSDEYETFTVNTLNLIWSWTSHQNKAVVEAAYKALEDFNMANFSLKMLPSHAKVGIKLPDSLAATPFEAARKPEDVLTYVPGEAWVNLVRGAKPSLLPMLESFVKSLIKREVSGLYKGIYLTAIQEAKKKGLKGSGGQPEPLNYDFLKEYSTLRATVAFFRNFPKDLEKCGNKDEAERLLKTLLIFVNALGQPLNRPYPALDWALFSPVQEAVKLWCQKNAKIDWDEKIRHAIFDVLAKQCNKSASASAFISKFLAPSTSNGLTQRDEVYLFGLMDYLGRGIPPATLTPFVGFTLNRYVGDSNQLKQMLDAVKPVLTSDFIHDTNRNGLGNLIEGLNEKIDPTNTSLYSSYKACVADLPSKHIERLTSPSLWWEVTDEKLYRAAVLRCHVARNDPDEMALPWLNDIVDSAASLPGERTGLLTEVAKTLTERCVDKESSAWFLQLLGQLLEQSKKKVPDNLVANHEHNQRLIFYVDLLMVSMVIWSGAHINYGVEKIVDSCNLTNELLPSAIHTLSERTAWQSTLPQFLNFLVSSFKNIEGIILKRYDLLSSALFIANLSADMNQQMWNKVVTLCLP